MYRFISVYLHNYIAVYVDIVVYFWILGKKNGVEFSKVMKSI